MSEIIQSDPKLCYIYRTARAMNAAKALVETALRVLIAWNEGREPASADLDLLKKASHSPAHVTPDEFREALRSPAIDS